jgi:hypothetical protein
MIAKLAYLTSPAPDRFVLHIQPWNSELTSSIEISRAHLANIIIDGASFSLRETSVSHRVPVSTTTENADDSPSHRTCV